MKKFLGWLFDSLLKYRIQVLNLSPTDVIVLQTDNYVSSDEVDRITKIMKLAHPGPIWIFDKDYRMTHIIKKASV